MLQKIYESLQKINDDYLAHGKDMEQLVLNSEKLNMDYENTMETTLNTMSKLPFI